VRLDDGCSTAAIVRQRETMKNIDFSRRNNLSQLMNSDDTDFGTFRACLVDLSKVNYLMLAYRPTLRFFEHLARSGRLPTDRSITVIDVGSGFGDMLRNVDRWAVRRGIKLDLSGVDQNPWSTRAAGEVAAPGRPIRFVTANIFAYRPASRVRHRDQLSVDPSTGRHRINSISFMDGGKYRHWLVCERSAPKCYSFLSLLPVLACAAVSPIRAA
jgi:hypothetical protein